MPAALTSAHTRGFTLIELMLTLGLVSIVVAGFGSVLAWQTRTLGQHIDEDVTDNIARSVSFLVRQYAYQAGYGFSRDANATGFAYTGDCEEAEALYGFSPTTNQCTATENNGLGDRLRFTYMDPTHTIVMGPTAPSGGPCSPDNSPFDASQLALAANTLNVPANSNMTAQYAYIAGECMPGSPVNHATGRYSVRGLFAANQKSCAYTLPIDPSEYYCTTGWKPGYASGLVSTIALMLRPNTATGDNFLGFTSHFGGLRYQPLAPHARRFEVTYGIDLSDPPDGKLDSCPTCVDDPYASQLGASMSWCRNLTSTCGLKDKNNVPYTLQQLYQRIVAVHVEAEITSTLSAPYKTYSTTVVLKNRQQL